ncbi:hypothetical protein M9Y10_004440 [Tritrichomonas musculus]|uniref:DNA recombination and repair protein Rad51-like C-terminal domain-containing protein n=1 Tax=Tritrichomonas musculus TaxID=1915356 RepID=A0ABR2JSC3_9EUKA
MSFADSSASEIYAKYSLPQIDYTIPIINEYFKDGPFNHPRLFVIMGHAQSYKTSIAVELLSTFTSFENLGCEAIWLDCDFKFPLDLLKARKINLEKLRVSQCRSSEEIIFDLLSIEHEINQEPDKGASLRAIVIDTISSSFWIDSTSSKLSCRTRFQLKEIIEQFVSSFGITMIVVMDDLGFDPWEKIENAPAMKLICTSRTPGKGQLIYYEPQEKKTFSESFTVLDDRSFRWGNNHLIDNPDEKPGNESNEFNE